MASMIAWSPALAEEAPLGRRLTLEEWLALSEDEPGEWFAGHLQEEEMTDPIHELAVTWFIAILRAWLGTEGFVLGSEVKMTVATDRGRKADIAIVLPGRGRPPRRGPLREPPTIVVEVVTPTPRDERRDRIEKMSEYAAFGIQFYWLVDPALGSFEVFELTDGRYVKLTGRTSGREEVPGCPGLVVDLDALWAELARLAPDDDA
jgi:Uma2 family endonuclease